MPVKYEVPEENYFRIHHIRPRFKNAVENVLVFMASEISRIPRMKQAEFMKKVNSAIKRYPGNATKKIKTINNWRTEISSLFGLIEFDSSTGECWPSSICVHLANNQDLVEFFKYFLFYFQYPGGHLKPHETLNFIKNGIKFKPAKCVLEVLKETERISGERYNITKAEATHCIFNDTRVTTEGREPEKVARLIIKNREESVRYDWAGDVIRYAGDILDYMVLADLLVVHGNKYFLNTTEEGAIKCFEESDIFFHDYDNLYSKEKINLEDIKARQDRWFHFVNQRIEEEIFKTDILKYISKDKSKYAELRIVVQDFYRRIGQEEGIRTQEVGDFGEYLVHGHECMRIKFAGREELIHLIKRIPMAYAVGYDITSVEIDGTKRLIEVKTTISGSRIIFNSFHMTTNEWKAAESHRKRYFIYRLMVSKSGPPTLYIIQDPVGKYKSELLGMTPREGADIRFKNKAGRQERLLTWKK